MRVILLERVENFGYFGDIVTVKSGFGRNYLIPKKKALRATKPNLERFESMRAEVEAENKRKRQETQSLAPSIEDRVVILIRQAAEDGRLYGSVTAKSIASALSEEVNTSISHTQIRMTQKFKSLGVYNIEIDLHSEVRVIIKLVIAMSEDNAKILLEASEKNSEILATPEESESQKIEPQEPEIM